ncbi:DUF2125 domain-containing protein [Arenibaculum sp.]|uniref:DUF2125 domain-containing protein n=1 Tax=Arenibaculum sp. TaxID=2865862 RepID=UPI002E153A9F|nr:DUF2125 domain-containing protein [Arenibaculum sp.]
MPRRSILIALLVLLAAGAAYTAWWLHLAGLVRERVEAWAAEERARAGLVEYRDLEIGGFPFRIAADTQAVRLVRPDGTEWRGESAAAWARPWNPGEIHVALAGTQSLVLPETELTAAGATGRISLEAGRFRSGRFALRDVAVGLPGGRFRAAGLNVAATPTGPAATGISIGVAGLDLPEELEAPLGRTIEAADVEAVIEGPLPGRADPASILGWAEQGGALRVDAAELRWGPLGLAGQGRIGFDAALRPSGSLVTEAEGVEPALDALAATGALRERDAAIAKAALGLLTQRRASDGAPVVEATLTLQDGWLYLGPVRLLPLPPLDVLLGRVRPASPR